MPEQAKLCQSGVERTRSSSLHAGFCPEGLAAGDGFALPRPPSKGDVLLLDDPAMNWWSARVTRPVQRIKSPLHHFNASRPKWCSRQGLHLHWRRSRRRASALGYASCWRSATRWSLQPVLPRQEFFTKEIRRLLPGGMVLTWPACQCLAVSGAAPDPAGL